MLNVSLSQIQLKQARLPISRDGIGIRSLQDLSLPAFISSSFGTMPLVFTILNIPVDSLAINSLNKAIELWGTECNEISSQTNSQHEWDKNVFEGKDRK